MGEKRTYTGKELGGYLVGMFGQNLIYNIVATGLYFYFQNVICLPGYGTRLDYDNRKNLGRY